MMVNTHVNLVEHLINHHLGVRTSTPTITTILVVFIGKHVKASIWVGNQCTQAGVNGVVAMAHLLQHHTQDDDIVDRGLLQ